MNCFRSGGRPAISKTKVCSPGSIERALPSNLSASISPISIVNLTALRSSPAASFGSKMTVGIAALTSSTRRKHSFRTSAGQLAAAQTSNWLRSARSLCWLPRLSDASLAARQSAVVGSAARAARSPKPPASIATHSKSGPRPQQAFFFINSTRS